MLLGYHDVMVLELCHRVSYVLDPSGNRSYYRW